MFNQEKQDELKKMNFLDLFLHPKDSLKDKERRSSNKILFIDFIILNSQNIF